MRWNMEPAELKAMRDIAVIPVLLFASAVHSPRISVNNNGPPAYSFDPAGYFATLAGTLYNGGGDKCVSAASRLVGRLNDGTPRFPIPRHCVT